MTPSDTNLAPEPRPSNAAARPPVLLIVDDDPLMLKSLEAFFTIETDYDPRTAETPAQALEIAAAEPLDLIVSDFMMPEINGVEFLKQVRALQPDAPRILLTGYADKENAIRGINEAGLYHYLEKPWDNDNLLLVVRNALEQRNLRQSLAEGARELNTLFSRYSDLDDQHRHLKREIEMAARVQRSLLPSEMPEAPPLSIAGRWIPCAELGGDFYDVWTSPETTLVLLADVSGHGLPAALAASVLKLSFREAAEVSAEPEEILMEMNGRLRRFMPQGLYACAMVACLRGSTIEMTNAGLPYPRVRRASGAVETLAMTGLPLALLPESPPGCHDSRKLELAPGDALLLTSDGLAEVSDSDGVPFDRERLDQSLRDEFGSVDARLDQLVEQSRAHGGGKPFDDDVSLLLISREVQ